MELLKLLKRMRLELSHLGHRHRIRGCVDIVLLKVFKNSKRCVYSASASELISLIRWKWWLENKKTNHSNYLFMKRKKVLL